MSENIIIRALHLRPNKRRVRMNYQYTNIESSYAIVKC